MPGPPACGAEGESLSKSAAGMGVEVFFVGGIPGAGLEGVGVALASGFLAAEEVALAGAAP
jgi:hypothetical protein